MYIAPKGLFTVNVFSPFNGPFFLLPIKRANWVEIHSVIQPVTIDTLLNKNGLF